MSNYKEIPINSKIKIKDVSQLNYSCPFCYGILEKKINHRIGESQYFYNCGCSISWNCNFSKNDDNNYILTNTCFVLPKFWKENINIELEEEKQHKCNCPRETLFSEGCKCGGI